MESELLIIARQQPRSCSFEVEDLADTFWVARFSGSEAISSLYEFDIDLVARHVDVHSLVGRHAVLRIVGLDAPRIVHGLVCRAEYAGELRPRALYRVSLVPLIYKLLLRTDCRIFQRKTTPEIVAQVLTAAGVPRRWIRLELSRTYRPRDYCVQYRESDLQFISRLMESDGIYYYFEHEERRHVLVISDRARGAPDIVGDVTLPFHATEGMVDDRESVSRFRVSEELRPTRVALRDFDLDRPDLKLEVGEATSTSQALELYDYPGEFQEPAAGSVLARTELEAAQATRRRGRGDSFCPRLAAGFGFTLSGHPRAELDGAYRVVQVHHSGEQPDILERGADHALVYRNEFVCMDSSITYRAPRTTPRPTMRGVQTATVVGPASEEIYVDDQGRVKVQFHWDREGAFDERSSCWIRVGQPWAGNGFGAMFIPRVGHEVIVDFLEGDPDRPLITGSVYHGINAAPYRLPEEKTKSTIKSETYQGGGSNELRFEDATGREQVLLRAQRDMDVCARNDRRESVLRHDHATVGGDRFARVDGDVHASVGGDETAAIGGDIRLKGGKDLDVEVASAARLRVGGDAHFTARGAQYVEVRGDHHSSTGGSLEHKVAGTVALESAQAFHVTAPMIVLEASAGLTLKGPGGFVTIDASGVSVQGTLVKLNSGGAALPVQSPAPRAPEPPRCPTPSAPTPAEGDER